MNDDTQRLTQVDTTATKSDHSNTAPHQSHHGGVESREEVIGKKDTEGEELMAAVVEHEPGKEIESHVQVRRETVHLSKELESEGVVSVGHPTFTTIKSVKLPLSDAKVYQGLHAPITTSLRWLAEICLRILKIMHMNLKKVHGRIVRVRY